MPEIGFFVWKIEAMPKNPHDLVAICHQFGINVLAFKVLNRDYKYNVPNGDRPLMEYFKVLELNGIKVEAWGYHTPDTAGAQGDAIEERREKLRFSTYHVDVESEWKEPWGMPARAKLLLGKPKVKNFEMLFCSYREPDLHAPVPFDAFMNHETIDGASPQLYWALKHNPVTQLDLCLEDYAKWHKPIYPIAPTFGASFKVNEKWYYWEPTVKDLTEFREACASRGLERFYYYSLDWAIAHARIDWLEAATGVNIPPNDPPIIDLGPEFWTVGNCKWLNCRSDPKVIKGDNDNVIAVVRAGQKVTNHFEDSGEWKKVGMGPITGWMHGDYLKE